MRRVAGKSFMAEENVATEDAHSVMRGAAVVGLQESKLGSYAVGRHIPSFAVLTGLRFTRAARLTLPIERAVNGSLRRLGEEYGVG